MSKKLTADERASKLVFVNNQDDNKQLVFLTDSDTYQKRSGGKDQKKKNLETLRIVLNSNIVPTESFKKKAEYFLKQRRSDEGIEELITLLEKKINSQKNKSPTESSLLPGITDNLIKLVADKEGKKLVPYLDVIRGLEEETQKEKKRIEEEEARKEKKPMEEEDTRSISTIDTFVNEILMNYTAEEKEQVREKLIKNVPDSYDFLESIREYDPDSKIVKFNERYDTKLTPPLEKQSKAEVEFQVALSEEDGTLKDNFLTEFKTDGYTEGQQAVINETISKLGEGGESDILREIIFQDLPISPEIIPQAQPAEPETATGLIVDPGTDMRPPPPEDPEIEEIVPATGPMTEKKERISESNAGPRPYIPRYHENSILLYFNNSSYPDWDLTLEANIMKMETSKEEIITMMEDIITEYGKKIFVSKRKSDTREELNELIQLQFCILRNLALGPRAKTANVKLSDLVKLDQLANNQANPQPPTGAAGANAPIGPPSGTVTVNPTQTIGPAEPVTQTKSEDAFIRNFDNYMLRKNLNLQATPPRVQPAQTYTGSDPRNRAIIPGNNLISLERNSVRRI